MDQVIIEKYVYQHKLDDLHKAEVFDFLPFIRYNSKSDQVIMHSWMDFLREEDIPFVVVLAKKGVKETPAYVLWKRWASDLDGPTSELIVRRAT